MIGLNMSSGGPPTNSARDAKTSSLSVRTPSGTPAFMGTSATPYVTNPQFNPGAIDTLTINIANNWDTNWSSTGVSEFNRWLNRLLGDTSWDVDNTGDGVPDSIWMDLGLPLQRTPDGKLLKALVSFYIDDLDGKIDINAAGGNAQANWYAANPTDPDNFNVPINQNQVAQRSIVHNTIAPLPQGMGFGPAEISFRHLLFPQLSQQEADNVYKQIMLARYSPATGPANGSPGSSGWGAPSRLLHLREHPYLDVNGAVLPLHRHGRLPGLPVGIRGRVSIALDRLGNPFIHNESDLALYQQSRHLYSEQRVRRRLISGAIRTRRLLWRNGNESIALRRPITAPARSVGTTAAGR